MRQNVLPMFFFSSRNGSFDQFKIGRATSICADVKMLAKVTHPIFQTALTSLQHLKWRFGSLR